MYILVRNKINKTSNCDTINYIYKKENSCVDSCVNIRDTSLERLTEENHFNLDENAYILKYIKLKTEKHCNSS